MRRRQFIAGVSIGLGAALAGCTGSDGPGNTGSTASSSTETSSTSTDEGLQELPGPDALLDQHAATVADMSFASEERIEQTSSASDERGVNTYSVRNGDAGTRVTSEERPPGADSPTSKTVWFTDNARISRDRHEYDPDGVTPPFVQRPTVTNVLDVAAFERAGVAGDDADETVYVFEAAGVDEAAAAEFDAEFEALDARAEVTASGYVRALLADFTFRQNPDAEETVTVTYDYELSDVGDVSVSAPDFVDDAVRIAGSLTDDRSALVLEHGGGPAVEEGTEVVVQDSEDVAFQKPATFPTEFEPGETAYVYWTAPDEAAIEVGSPPSEVERKFVLPAEDGDRSVYLESRSRPGRQFEVAIHRRA